MDQSAFNILVGIAGLLAVVALIKPDPQWRLTSVSVLLICIALFTKGK